MSVSFSSCKEKGEGEEERGEARGRRGEGEVSVDRLAGLS
jgi:hypothetical protein